ncbi:MAG: CbtB-domain containing protein [Nitrosopumilus sp.]|nr:CbtB-domain containing protein [Nitrosopumilus sp.]
MSLFSQRKVISEHDDSKIAIGFLAAIALFGVFVVGFDQGQVFSIVQGNEAFDTKYLHEVTHDMRHAAGFPCH